jgi:hypothetical protein
MIEDLIKYKIQLSSLLDDWNTKIGRKGFFQYPFDVNSIRINSSFSSFI